MLQKNFLKYKASFFKLKKEPFKSWQQPTSKYTNGENSKHKYICSWYSDSWKFKIYNEVAFEDTQATYPRRRIEDMLCRFPNWEKLENDFLTQILQTNSKFSVKNLSWN